MRGGRRSCARCPGRRSRASAAAPSRRSTGCRRPPRRRSAVRVPRSSRRSRPYVVEAAWPVLLGDRGSPSRGASRFPGSRLPKRPLQAFTGLSPKRHPNAVWRRSASPSLRLEAARTSPASRVGIPAACPTEDLPSRQRTFPADAQGAREAHAHSAGEPTRRHGGSRHRGARIPRDRRRRLARHQLRLPGGRRRAEALAARAPPRAVIFTGWSSTGGPAEADQMAQEWQGPPRHPRDPRAARRQHRRERGSLARSSCARSRMPRRSCWSARSVTSRACVSSSTGSTAATATRRATATSCGRSRPCRSSATSCDRSRAWRETGAVRSACWTRRR